MGKREVNLLLMLVCFGLGVSVAVWKMSVVASSWIGRSLEAVLDPDKTDPDLPMKFLRDAENLLVASGVAFAFFAVIGLGLIATKLAAKKEQKKQAGPDGDDQARFGR